MMENIRPEIQESFIDLFDDSEQKHICLICNSLQNKQKRENAINKLICLFKDGPKRPCYYLLNELNYLPEQTRDAVRYCGDYLDQLAKQCSKDLHGINKLFSPFGHVLDNIQSIIGERLQNKLRLFNKLFYTEAKHNFEVENRDHLFSSNEVVFCCYVTRKLADEILKKSKTARLYNSSLLIGDW